MKPRRSQIANEAPDVKKVPNEAAAGWFVSRV